MTRVRRVLVSVAGLAAAALALIVVHVPLASGAFVARNSNPTNSAGTATYFTCTSAAQGESATKAYFALPLSESKGTSAADVSGNARPGTYTSAGVTYDVAGTICPRETDHTVVTLDGTSGYILNTTQLASPQTFSEEIWFKTSFKQGKLIGLGSSNSVTGATSGNYDRHLYIDSNGFLEFGVYNNGVFAIKNSVSVADGAWHYAVATMGTSGMALYLDGTLIGTNANSTGETDNGYIHIGFDSLSGWPSAPTSNFFKGQLAWAGFYSYTMTAAQVASHYRAGSAT